MFNAAEEGAYLSLEFRSSKKARLPVSEWGLAPCAQVLALQLFRRSARANARLGRAPVVFAIQAHFCRATFSGKFPELGGPEFPEPTPEMEAVLEELKMALAEHTERLRKMAARKLLGNGEPMARKTLSGS
jgi:hypothetical protein